MATLHRFRILDGAKSGLRARSCRPCGDVPGSRKRSPHPEAPRPASPVAVCRNCSISARPGGKPAEAGVGRPQGVAQFSGHQGSTGVLPNFHRPQSEPRMDETFELVQKVPVGGWIQQRLWDATKWSSTGATLSANPKVMDALTEEFSRSRATDRSIRRFSQSRTA